VPSGSSGSLTIEQVLTLLSETPGRIEALTAGLTSAQSRTPPSRGEWSASDVLAHLRACADVWGGCIATMLAEDAPTLRAINPRAWIKKTGYPGLEFQPSLRAFAAQRAELLAVLEPLPREAWSRMATVTGAGSVLHRTVLSYAQRMARHERPHVKQIARIATALRVRV
jgi:DinB family protein